MRDVFAERPYAADTWVRQSSTNFSDGPFVVRELNIFGTWSESPTPVAQLDELIHPLSVRYSLPGMSPATRLTILARAGAAVLASQVLDNLWEVRAVTTSLFAASSKQRIEVLVTDTDELERFTMRSGSTIGEIVYYGANQPRFLPPAFVDEVPSVAAPYDAIEIADELRQWLDLTYDGLEEITGISRSTFLYWRRSDGTPRPSTMHKLLRVHALVHAIFAQLGHEQARAWFASGPESPLELLSKGAIDVVEKAAFPLLFADRGSQDSDRFSAPAFALEADFDIQDNAPSQSLQRAARRARRERLEES